MFNRTDDWPSAKGTMLTVLKQKPDDPRLMLLFADMLLQHREVTDAIPLLEKCQKLGVDKSPQYIALQAQVLAMQDQPELAISTAKSLVTPPLSPEQIPQLKTVANLLEAFAGRASNPEPYYEAAGELYREYVREVPDEVLLLAKFQGLHGDIDEALNLCEGAMPTQGAEDSIRTAIMFSRSRSADLTPERRQRMQGWIDAAIKDNSKGGEILVLQADFFDFEGKYAECEKIYSDLLSDKSLSPYLRATVLNNLAYLLAVKNQQGDKAMTLIEEAVQLVGPISELLDTRGMVHLARGDSKLAIQDLRRSIADSASPIKLFHLAHALLQDQDDAAAAEAFRQAEELGLKPADVSAIERKNYDNLQARFPS
jgi:tetratricopeptide (TPR) repeat protein